MTKIIICSCPNEYQDKKYGKGNRVHNWATAKTMWRCTVCKAEKK